MRMEEKQSRVYMFRIHTHPNANRENEPLLVSLSKLLLQWFRFAVVWHCIQVFMAQLLLSYSQPKQRVQPAMYM